MIIEEEERMEGVFVIASITKAFPKMDTSIKGTFRTQFMFTSNVSELPGSSLKESGSTDPLFSPLMLLIFNPLF